MASGAQAKADKVRSLLASYYEEDGSDSTSAAPSPVAWTPSSAPAPSPGTAPRADTSALNTSYFDPDAYLRRMLKETRLGELASKARAMMSEVGSLDSDMQQLVYENYNKFITATDTIKLMSSSMQGMDGRMQSLEQLIDRVEEKSNSVNGKLQQRQERIEELNQVRLLLRKLQGVFELPRRLRAAIDAQAYDVAVDTYSEVAPLLQKYGHKGAFKKVAGEVASCVEELTAILRQQLLSQPDTAAECVAKLGQLGAPIEPLQEAYMECKRQRMETILAACGLMLKRLAVQSGLMEPGAVGAADPALRQKMEQLFPGSCSGSSSGSGTGDGEGAAAEGLPSLKQVIITLNSSFMTELTQTAGLFTELFAASGRKQLVKVARELLQRYLKLIRRALADAAATSAAAAAGITTAGQLAAPLEQLLDLAPPGGGDWAPGRHAGVETSLAADWGAGALLEGLYVVKNDLSRLHGLLPELSPRDKGHEVVTNAVRQHVALCFTALERRALSTVQDLAAQLAACDRNDERKRETMVAGVAVLEAVLVQGTERLLVSLKDYQRQRWVLQSWLDEFINAVHGQMQNLFLTLAQQLLVAAKLAEGPATTGTALAPSATFSAAESSVPFAAPASRKSSLEQPGSPVAEAPASPALLLMLCKVAGFAEQEAVASGLVMLQHLFPAPSSGDQPPAFLPTDLARRLSATAAALLQGYTERQGQLLALAARQSTAATDWVNHREPRQPRPFCDLLLEKLAEVEVEVSYLSDEASTGYRAGHHSRIPSTSSAASWEGGLRSAGPSDATAQAGASSFMEASVSRMLAARDRGPGDGSAQLEFTRLGVAAAVLAIALQALVESVRQQTIGRAGLQQLQLDVHYLRPQVQRYAAGSLESPAVMQLFDEVMAAGAERCMQPLLLDPTVLDRILAQAAAQRQAGQQQHVSLL